MSDVARQRLRLGNLGRSWAMGTYLFLVFFFLMLPVAVVMLASVSNTSYLVVPPKGVTFRWYQAVLDNREFTDAILYSLKLAAVTTAGSVALGVAAAYALVRRTMPGAAAVSAMLMAPLAFPAVVIGVALLQFYSLLGVSGSFAGLVAAHMVITVPYVVRAVLASLAGADAVVEDAARTLGANRWVAFFTVTLPLIRPGVVAGALFAFIVSFDNVPVTIFLLDVRNVTLPVKIFTAIEYGVDPSIAAVSTMLIVVTGLFLVAAERWLGFHRFV
ncbi:MAG: ABC transporter permease [Alphaproteobacteria bacterium]